MATVRKRTANDGTVTWNVQVRLKGLAPQSASFDKLADARKWALQIEGELRKGSASQPLTVDRTVREAIQRYRREVFPLKPKAVRMQDQQLEWWDSFLGPKLLREVTPSLLSEAREALARRKTPAGKQVSPGTVNRYLAALSHVFTVACNEWEWHAANPMMRVKRRKEPRGRVRYLSDDERRRLLSACAESGNRALPVVVLLALGTGMRYSEVMGLRWKDVDLARGRVVLHETKNGERRVVPVPKAALDALSAHAELASSLGKGLVFPAESDASRPADIRSAWLLAVSRAELDDFRFHDLRHSTASYLAMSGASLAEIAEVLGHKTLQMVKRYAHLSEAHTAGVVERMAGTFLKLEDDVPAPAKTSTRSHAQDKPVEVVGQQKPKTVRRPGGGMPRATPTLPAAPPPMPVAAPAVAVPRGGGKAEPRRTTEAVKTVASPPDPGPTPAQGPQKAPRGPAGPAKGGSETGRAPAKRGRPRKDLSRGAGKTARRSVIEANPRSTARQEAPASSPTVAPGRRRGSY